jgi:prephenate dehydrogenase
MSVYNRIAVIGLGLMGGSLLKRIHAQFPGADLFAVDKNKEVLKKAGPLLFDGFQNIFDLPKDLDLVIIAVPQSAFISSVIDLSSHMSLDTIFTDILSVKSESYKQVDDLNLRHEFVWAHPMSGKEVSGFDNSEESLIIGSSYLIIKSDEERLLNDFSAFVTELGSTPVFMETAETHDKAVAKISHFPYLMSSLTVPEKEENLKSIIGPGFKDTTRIASSSPEWGVEVLLSNKEFILDDLKRVQADTELLKLLLENNDTEGLHSFLTTRKTIRDSLV